MKRYLRSNGSQWSFFCVHKGVAFYDDLNRPLLVVEAEKTYKYITGLAKLILPSVVTSMNGGFRR